MLLSYVNNLDYSNIDVDIYPENILLVVIKHVEVTCDLDQKVETYKNNFEIENIV